MKLLSSFPPFADDRSRILILGTMPGPVALARRQYYGFPGNHFWRILPEILEAAAPRTYREKIRLLKDRRIALWDVIRTCTRTGASDSSIRSVLPNDIPGLLRRRRAIRTIFLNGRTAETLYRRHFGDVIRIPAYTLPSTSPAHASMSYEKKKKAWSAILPYLENRNEWC
ncbi:MAG TPA: DNA-deoxyinosine glycosylase [Candidatus Eisenbacteria bacterium]|nr:DNA-deoxyinosine glycosylase [Candidatus Eisenbacteria bacterium]